MNWSYDAPRIGFEEGVLDGHVVGLTDGQTLFEIRGRN